jgi:hexokinase
MQQGLDRKKRFPHVSIRIMAMLNDTTGCLMACARSFSCTRIGIIVGTGTNVREMY